MAEKRIANVTSVDQLTQGPDYRIKVNEELIETLQPKWYENTYLWLGIGFILGKI